MKLVTARECPLAGRVLTYKQSLWSAVLGLAFVGGGTAAMSVGIVRGALPGLLWVMVVILGLISLLFVGMLRAAMGPDNWVVKFDGSTLAFKFRSYLNRHFPAEDRVVAVFSPSEFERVRKTVELVDVPSAKGGQATRQTWVSLDFEIRDEAAARQLDAAIREELARQAPKIGRGRTKHHHAPMRIVEGRTLRVHWKSPRDYVRPGVDTALRDLGAGLRVEAEQSGSGRRWEELAEADREGYILELAQRGNRMEAVRLARELHGLELRESRLYVDELVRGGSGSAGRNPQ